MAKIEISDVCNWILQNIKMNGNFFVDIGAHDGITSSNTYILECMDWKGICIEPHPEVFPKLKKNRKSLNYNCCISSSNDMIDFMVVEGYAEMLSGIVSEYDNKHMQRIDKELLLHGGKKKIVKIESKTLDSILLENNINNIDYLSIDVEGGELEVLKSVNLIDNNINVISVENNGYHDLVKEYLIKNGYEYLITISSDEIFKKII